MTKEAFAQEIRRCLAAECLRHPAMEAQDTVKFVFQAMLGMGHLLSARGAAADFIAREMAGLKSDAAEPLLEALSPSFCRLSLRRAIAEGLGPDVIAGMMLASPGETPFSRQDVYALCAGLTGQGKPYDAGKELLGRIMEENWLPSHSDAYRAAYRPAYRVIAAELTPCMEIIRRIAAMQAGKKRLLVTIDGPCASGKTTLAGRLAAVFEAAQAHTDDFVIPHAQKTAERLAIPGGNCDAERLAGEVAAPWKAGGPVWYRKYDCGQDRLLPPETLPDSDLLILEGSYSSLPAIRQYADLNVFVDTPADIRFARLEERESPESMRQFRERWIPLENAYFAAYKLPDENCLIVRQ